MNNRLEIKLWLIHRLTGMVLGLFVLIHLITMIIVIQGGVSGEEIIGRTHGNYLLGLYYSLFVISAALHGSIGLRTVAKEVLAWHGPWLNLMTLMFCSLLCFIGLAAVKGLVL
jgi:fumarate reductase subunit C